MKFILAEEQTTRLPSLKDVEDNQFFINTCGSLCQKITDTSYSIIANAAGELFGDYCLEQSINTLIKKVLPKVLKIEF